jgi:hypothetical protein
VKQFIALVAAIVIGVGFGQWVTGTRPLPQPGSPAAVPVTSYRPSIQSAAAVTLAEYSQIRSGMSYWEVRAVIGDAGTEMSRNHLEGVPGVMESIDTVMYLWTNADGSNMNAMFQNDKLIQKAQFGLR